MNILITGGTGGIGAALVDYFLLNPANRVVVTFHRNHEQAARYQLRSSKVDALPCDFSDENKTRAVAEQLTRIEFDLMIFNAFPKLTLGPLHQSEWDLVQKNVEIGVRSTYILARALTRPMKKSKAGTVVTILSSVVDGVSPPQMAPYVMAKMMLLGLHRSLFAEIGRSGVGVYAVSPDMVDTNFLSELPDHYVQLAREATPKGYLLNTGHVVQAVKDILAGRHENGANILIRHGATG